jgi:hypothetical protein
MPASLTLSPRGRVAKWKRVLITRTIALGPAIFFALMSADNPTLGDEMNQWLNVLQSVQLPFALLPVLHFTSRANIMGSFKNGVALQCVTWALALLVIFVNFFLVYESVPAGLSAGPIACIVAVGIAYISFIGIIVSEDVIGFIDYLRRDSDEKGLLQDVAV